VEAVAKILKKKKIDFIYCSPLHRTKQTCEIINKEVKKKIVYDDRLKETNFGIFNGKPEPELHRAFKDRMQRFVERPEHGESWLDVKRRVMNFIREINAEHDGKNILIISHGDPLWMLGAATMGLTNRAALDQQNDLTPGTGQFRELVVGNHPYDENGRLDLHRPYVDEIYLKCSKCKKGKMNRIKEVADVWFDSGSMPFASGEYPDRFPADYICEAMDQTRGWFYTLLAVSTLMKQGEPYKNVISLGLILDKKGQKMSKSRGNTVDPWQTINRYGVDALRWYFYSVNQPGDVKKFDSEEVGKSLRRVILMLYNSYVFYETYAFKEETRNKKQETKSILDRWILARYSESAASVAKHLDNYCIYEAARELEVLVDDLSRWYIRRSRKRFQQPIKGDWEQASLTLRFVLEGLAKLMAPFTPFFSEALHLSFNENSVHLADYPTPSPRLRSASKADQKLLGDMREVRRLASLALAKRAEVKIKVRQPLAVLKVKGLKVKEKELLAILAEEVNVKKVASDNKLKVDLELDTKLTPTLKREGQLRELVRMVQGLRRELGLDPKDEVNLVMHLPEELQKAVMVSKQFKKDVNAKEIEFKKPDRYQRETTTHIDGQKIWLGIKK